MFTNSLYNGFDPFLLPVILIIYSKLSLCPVTRNISGTMLVSYLLSIVIPTYMPTTSDAILSSASILVFGFCLAATHSETILGLLLLVWMIFLTCVIYGCLFFGTGFDIVVFGVSIMHHSNMVWRESLLTLIVSCSYSATRSHEFKMRDIQLGLLTGFLYFL